MEKRAEEESATQEDRQPRGGIAVYVANLYLYLLHTVQSCV